MSVYLTREMVASAGARPYRPVDPGPIERLVRAVVRRWQHRKMIAMLEAMDDWMLRDIGIRRDEIPALVAGFSDRELRMAPLASARRHPTEMEGAYLKAA